MENARKQLTISSLLFVLALVVTLSKAENNSTICYKGTNNTSHVPQFQENLISVFSMLATASSTTHFYNATVGSTQEDQVFAVFSCSYGIALSECHDCISGAITDQLNFCRGFREALSFYRKCTLHYANRTIVSQLRMTQKAAWCDYPSLRDRLLNQTVEKTVLGLIDDVTSGGNDNRYYYATGEETYMVYQTLYCQVQCSPDITPSDCRKCLTGALYYALYMCSISIGETFSYESCSLMYSFYPFYNISSNRLASQPLLSSPSFSTVDRPNSSPAVGPDTLSIAVIWVVLLLMDQLRRG